MSLLRRIFVFSSSLYLILAALMYTFQEGFIFHPMPVPPDYQYKFTSEIEDVWVENEDGRLHGILFKAGHAPRGVVLYFKGNMGNVGHSEDIARIFLNLGFDVLSMDYRGSGKSIGPLSEAKLLHDAELWHDWASGEYGTQVRSVGYSLGTTFASHLAGVKQVPETILFAPMHSIAEISSRRFPFIPTFLVRYPFNNYEKLAVAPGRVLIYHGTTDRIIPFESGESLSAALTEEDVFFRVEGANHYNVPYHNAVLVDIAQKWAPTP